MALRAGLLSTLDWLTTVFVLANSFHINQDLLKIIMLVVGLLVAAPFLKALLAEVRSTFLEDGGLLGRSPSQLELQRLHRDNPPREDPMIHEPLIQYGDGPQVGGSPGSPRSPGSPGIAHEPFQGGAARRPQGPASGQQGFGHRPPAGPQRGPGGRPKFR